MKTVGKITAIFKQGILMIGWDHSCQWGISNMTVSMQLNAGVRFTTNKTVPKACCWNRPSSKTGWGCGSTKIIVWRHQGRYFMILEDASETTQPWTQKERDRVTSLVYTNLF